MKSRPSFSPNSAATDLSARPFRRSFGKSALTYASNSSFVALIPFFAAYWRIKACRKTSLSVRGLAHMEYSSAGLFLPVNGSPAHMRRSLSCIETATMKSAFVKRCPFTRRKTSFFFKSDIRRAGVPTYTPGTFGTSSGLQPERTTESKTNPDIGMLSLKMYPLIYLFKRRGGTAPSPFSLAE